jgi:F0F1-type ATP synthase epsilon subunit
MQKIWYRSLFTKLSVGVAFAALAYIVCFTPAAEAQSPSKFEGGDIVITSTNASFHDFSGGPEKFEVADGTIAQVLYFEPPHVVDGEVWRKFRVADGNWGYAQEDSFDAYTGTVPTIWLELNYQSSQVHINYEARKRDYNIVIDQGVEYVNPNGDNITSNDTDAEEQEDEEEEQEEVDEEEEEEDEEEEQEEVDEEEEEEDDLNGEANRELLLLIIKLLQELLSLKLQNMQ